LEGCVRFLAVFAAMVCIASGQTTTAKKKAPVPAAKSSAKGTAASAKAAPKAAPKAAAKANTKGKRPVAVRRPVVQQQPSVDRYKEIQQALADKGYFSGMVDGAWGPGSVDALKRFQKDQNLDVDGKIGALSLMALGLGPKRGAASAENLVTPGAKPEPVDPPPVAQPETPELPPGVQPEK
jgi:peptidoglycan hydrolase-like protein with peptidoglycan-binding domain